MNAVSFLCQRPLHLTTLLIRPDFAGPLAARLTGFLFILSADNIYLVCCFVQYVEDNLGVMSVGFLLASPSDAVIWRGPKKNGERYFPIYRLRIRFNLQWNPGFANL